jgi:hypothetical protein
LKPAEIQEYAGLAAWWDCAERIWQENKRETDSSTLLERANFHNQLESQLAPTPHRVAYLASGTSLAAVRVPDRNAIIEHKLYWGAAATETEAQYLVSVLNSRVMVELVRDLQSRGQFGPRDFDKYVWYAPVPVYDESVALHVDLAILGSRAETVAQSVDLASSTTFRRARTAIWNALIQDGVARELDEAVSVLLRGEA